MLRWQRHLHFAGADYVSLWSGCCISQTVSCHPSVSSAQCFNLNLLEKWKPFSNLQFKAKEDGKGQKCTDRSWFHMLVKNKALSDWHKPLLKGMWRRNLHGRKQVLLFYFVWDSSPFHYSWDPTGNKYINVTSEQQQRMEKNKIKKLLKANMVCFISHPVWPTDQ